LSINLITYASKDQTFIETVGGLMSCTQQRGTPLMVHEAPLRNPFCEEVLLIS